MLGFILFFGAINGVQNAYIARKLMFKELFKLSVLAMLISGISGVLAAYLGLGLWALVIQQLVNHAAIMIILWFSIGWRPVYKFSLSRVKQLLSFGYKLLLSSTIDTLYRELRTLIIGKVYSSSTLGFYNKGEQFPKLIMSHIDGSIQAEMLPTLSSRQDDRPKVKAMMPRSIVTSCFVVFPVMIGLSVIAEPLVRLLLTEKWIPAVPYLQVFSLSYMLWPIHTANLQAINALGRSDIFLKLELLKKILGVTILSISVPLGVFAIAIGSVVGGIVASFINAMPNKKLLDYSYTEQILDVFPSLVAAIVMGFVVFFVSFMGLHVIFQILVQIIVGAIVYLSIAHVFKFESYVYLKTYLTDIFSNRKESYVMEKKNDNKQ